MDGTGVVIVGAGAAGAGAAGTLRRSGYRDRITVIRGEADLPYNRTTVNKALLQGTVSVDTITLPEATTPDVEWLATDHAVSVDPTARTVALASGRTLGYDHLIVATGASPRPFPGDVTGDDAHQRLLTLRTAGDTHRLRSWTVPDGSNGDGPVDVTVLGAGLIGSETASVLSAAGAHVRLVSLSPTPMSEHLGRIAGAHLTSLHERHVETHFGRTITAVDRGEHGRIVATLSSGDELSSDVMLVSIGVTPNTGWLSGARMDISDGVAVDQRLRVHGVTGVYAAGDVARITDDDGLGHRVEHWNHALAQGRHAALSLMHDAGIGGTEDPGAFDELASYTTQLYGTRLAIVGHAHTFAEEIVVDGDPSTGRFTVAMTDDEGRIVGVVGVGGARLANALKPAVHANDPLEAALKAARS